jgi:hypothetical protein
VYARGRCPKPVAFGKEIIALEERDLSGVSKKTARQNSYDIANKGVELARLVIEIQEGANV